jgi:threonyl-tRNA synthetase
VGQEDCGTARGRSDQGARGPGARLRVNEGDGAFYGPKIDLHMTDSIGPLLAARDSAARYYMPERFERPTRAPTTRTTAR